MLVLREGLSVDSQNIPCATLKRRGSWVTSVYLVTIHPHSTRIKRKRPVYLIVWFGSAPATPASQNGPLQREGSLREIEWGGGGQGELCCRRINNRKQCVKIHPQRRCPCPVLKLVQCFMQLPNFISLLDGKSFLESIFWFVYVQCFGLSSFQLSWFRKLKHLFIFTLFRHHHLLCQTKAEHQPGGSEQVAIWN